ncbi:lipopolysaccharide biosynthesis protein [bacterium]|nr:lipopolysaccharide biosynthesis protein [bacterium]
MFPKDFGIVAIGLFVIGGFSLFHGLGLGPALIQRKKNIEDSIDTVFLLFPVIGICLFTGCFISAKYAAIFFKGPLLEPIIKVLSISFLISSFEAVPSTLLVKQIEFKKKFIPEVCSAVGYIVVSISLAINGWGVWSLVYGYLTSMAVNTVFLWLICRWRPRFKFNRLVARELFSYGKYLLGSVIVAFLIIQGDKAVVGRCAGLTASGYYSFAYIISNLPTTNFTMIFTGVMFPLLSKLQGDIAALRMVFLKSLKFICLIILPILGTLFILSRDFVTVVLGQKWMPMLGALRILCLFGFLRSLHNLSGSFLQATGEAKFEMRTLIMELTFMSIAIVPFTLVWGIAGTSIVVTSMILIGVVCLFNRVYSILLFSRRSFFRALKTSFFGTMGMMLIIYSFKYVIGSRASFNTLLVSCILGSICYLLIILIVDKEIVAEAGKIIRLVLKP